MARQRLRQRRDYFIKRRRVESLEPDNKAGNPKARRPGGKVKRIAIIAPLVLLILLLLGALLWVCGCGRG